MVGKNEDKMRNTSIGGLSDLVHDYASTLPAGTAQESMELTYAHLISLIGRGLLGGLYLWPVLNDVAQRHEVGLTGPISRSAR